MSYDEVEIEDMDWKEDLQAFTYSCPCGDLFQISLVGNAEVYLERCSPPSSAAEHTGPVVCFAAGGASSRRRRCTLSKLYIVHHSHI